MNIKKSIVTVATLSALTAAPMAMANNWEGKANDAWLDGKIETAIMLNGELNNFDIDTDVKNSIATLSGKVKNETEKELAGQIAMNVDGVSDVNNKLTIDGKYDGEKESEGQSFSRTWHDMTITAGLNMKYATSDSLSAMDIDVDTENGVVTLTGNVKSEAARDLAIETAEGYANVVEVKDNLTITNS